MPTWPNVEGVNWGTTIVPQEHWINLEKPLRTRSGLPVVHPVLKLTNSTGAEVTFPVKGSIIEPRKQPRYCIWTLDGRTMVVGDHPRDDDLVECDVTREDFSYEVDKFGYMLKFHGKNIGGAGTDRNREKPMHWRHARQNVQDYKETSEREIRKILDGKGDARYWRVICRILHDRHRANCGFQSA